MRRGFLFTTGVLLLASVCVPRGAAAQIAFPRYQNPPTVAYISSQRISNETIEGKAGQAKLKAFQEQKAAELREKQRALQETRDLLSRTEPEKRVALQEQEQKQRTDLEAATVLMATEVQRMQRLVSTDLAQKIRAVLDQLLKGRDIQLVLQSESVVIWSVPGSDLTNEVIERLNAAEAQKSGK